MPATVFDPVELPSNYAKAIVAILTAALTVVIVALTDGVITPVEAVQVLIAVVAAIGVYLVPNLATGPARWAKLWIALLGTGLQALAQVLVDGMMTPQGLLVVLLAMLGAVSVGIIPNTPTGYQPERALAG